MFFSFENNINKYNLLERVPHEEELDMNVAASEKYRYRKPNTSARVSIFLLLYFNASA